MLFIIKKMIGSAEVGKSMRDSQNHYLHNVNNNILLLLFARYKLGGELRFYRTPEGRNNE